MSEQTAGIELLDAAHEEWMRHLPSDIREQFSKAKVRASLASMPDDTPVGVDLAAVYLCTSPATLKRMRAEGTGPKYLQPKTNEGSTARNQKISYLLGELKGWLRAQSTASTMHAAELRGTMFATLQDLATLEPFWVSRVKGVEAVLGHVLAKDVAGLLSDEEAQIKWLDWGAALGLPWADPEMRQTFEKPYRSLLLASLNGSDAGREATDMLTIIP